MKHKLSKILVLICFGYLGILLTSCFSSIIGVSDNKYDLGILPIISVGSNEIIGGVVNGRWVDGKTVAAHLKDFKYLVYKFDKVVGTGNARIVSDNFIKQKLSTGIDPDGVFWGLVDKYNPSPRKAYRQKGSIDLYKNLVREHIQEEGLQELKPDKIMIWRVDLDGDGVEEVIITDAEWNDNEAFSIVILRKLIGNTVKNIVLLKESDKRVKGKHTPMEPLLADSYGVSAILDLNGDGNMEIIFGGEGFESILLEVFEVRGNEAVKVIDYSTRRFWYKENYLEK